MATDVKKNLNNLDKTNTAEYQSSLQGHKITSNLSLQNGNSFQERFAVYFVGLRGNYLKSTATYKKKL